jgi:Skp family chaperone for outer membrane proteins
MRNLFVASGLLCAAGAVVGCGYLDGSGSGGVAVVDLDAVAERLGRNVEIGAALKQQGDALNQKLATYEATLKKQLADKQTEFGPTPTEQQQQQLRSAQVQINYNLGLAKREARTNLLSYKQQLIKRFREEVKPTIREVAASNGLTIVIPKDENMLLTVEQNADITEAVVAKLSEKGPIRAAATKPEAPADAEAESDVAPTTTSSLRDAATSPSAN